MDYFDLREVGKFDNLRKQLFGEVFVLAPHQFFLDIGKGTYLKGGRNHRLASNCRSHDCEYQAGIEHPGRDRCKERIRVGTRVLADVCRLADVLGQTLSIRSLSRYFGRLTASNRQG